MVLDNMTNAEILATNQDYILQIDKLDKIRTTILTERFKETVRLELEVIYQWCDRHRKNKRSSGR